MFGIPCNISANVGLTPSTILFDPYSIQSTATGTVTLIDRFPVTGTFEFRMITTKLTLPPFTLVVNSCARSITYLFGTVYYVQSGCGSSVDAIGAYDISGPNATVHGQFDVALFSGLPYEIDVGSYPCGVLLRGPTSFGGIGTVFEGTVDGVSLNVKATEIRFAGADATMGLTPPLTKLSIRRTESNFELSWPTNSCFSKLQQATKLPGSTWAPVTNAVARIGEQFVVRLAVSDEERFFRLTTQ